MKPNTAPPPSTIWLLLISLTLISTFVAEVFSQAHFAVISIFVIAAAKGDLVIIHYMEAGSAQPHWKIMYRIWLGVVTLMLIFAHLIV